MIKIKEKKNRKKTKIKNCLYKYKNKENKKVNTK